MKSNALLILCLIAQKSSAIRADAANGFFLAIGGIDGKADNGHTLEGQFGTIYTSTDGKEWTQVPWKMRGDFGCGTVTILSCGTLNNSKLIKVILRRTPRRRNCVMVSLSTVAQNSFRTSRRHPAAAKINNQPDGGKMPPIRTMPNINTRPSEPTRQQRPRVRVDVAHFGSAARTGGVSQHNFARPVDCREDRHPNALSVSRAS